MKAVQTRTGYVHPFKKEDVLHRYTPPGLGEVVFAKSEPSNVYPVTMYYHAGRHWECATPNMRDVTELLRQLAAKDEQVAAAVAAERKLRREQEVEPLKTALRALLSNSRDIQCWQSNLDAVQKIQGDLP